MTSLTQAPLDATGRNPQAPAQAPGRATPNPVPAPDSITLPDGLALWAGREEFLDWCRERGIRGQPFRHTECLIARALETVTGHKWSAGPWLCRIGPDAPPAVDTPAWLFDLLCDFDRGKLPEFTEC